MRNKGYREPVLSQHPYKLTPPVFKLAYIHTYIHTYKHTYKHIHALETISVHQTLTHMPGLEI